MALCKFGHCPLFSKLSLKLYKLEPLNLMNKLVVISRWPDWLLNKFWKILHELWPIVILSILPCQQNISKTVGATALTLGELIVMALCKYGHFPLFSKISLKLYKLEPLNLMNRLVVISRWPDWLLNKFWKILHELWPFVILSILPCQQNISKTVGATALTFGELIGNDE